MDDWFLRLRKLAVTHPLKLGVLLCFAYTGAILVVMIIGGSVAGGQIDYYLFYTVIATQVVCAPIAVYAMRQKYFKAQASQ